LSPLSPLSLSSPSSPLSVDDCPAGVAGVGRRVPAVSIILILKRNGGAVNETHECAAIAHRMGARQMRRALNERGKWAGVQFIAALASSSCSKADSSRRAVGGRCAVHCGARRGSAAGVQFVAAFAAPSIYDADMSDPESLVIAELRNSYLSGRETPAAVIGRLLERTAGADDHHIWITRSSQDAVMSYVAALDPGAIERLPLYGIPFVIKDNIDLAGIATTAGCPGYAYTPAHSAYVVERLLAAGAIPLGKTNLDQFATGLVGTRSPYGACRNSFDPDFISGGSSSGSAVAVALGLASFSLGTDTAGSGRVPAAFNNIVGLKPSHGRLSTRGVVPACRSLDCVSIFALTAEDAAVVLGAAQGFDAADPYSRRGGDPALSGLRFGVPAREQLQFFGDQECPPLFAAAVRRLESLGGTVVEIDFAAFLEAARLLYEGPWIAERYAAVGAFIEAHPEAVNPLTRRIIEAGKSPTAVAAFEGEYRLLELKRRSESVWAGIDLILTPTAGTIYRVREVEADPVRLNSNLGYYTNFMNLFDLSGVAVPAGLRSDGLPFGVTLVGPRGAERALLDIGGRMQRAAGGTLGALGLPLPEPVAAPAMVREGFIALAVCGAHMQGLPLNHQLRDRGGYLVRAGATAARYRLFALPGGPPHRPGLIRVEQDGAAIQVEVWALPSEHLGSFVAAIPAPLGVGKLELENGEWVSGFICEGYATRGAADITRHGGWRAYIAMDV
jgi:allophanate hydrolase